MEAAKGKLEKSAEAIRRLQTNSPQLLVYLVAERGEGPRRTIRRRWKHGDKNGNISSALVFRYSEITLTSL